MTGKYQILENNGKKYNPYGLCEGFDSIEEFKARITQLGNEGWTFFGLHPWHMGANLDIVYVTKEVA